MFELFSTVYCFLHNSTCIPTLFWYLQWETALSRDMTIKEKTLNSQMVSKPTDLYDWFQSGQSFWLGFNVRTNHNIIWRILYEGGRILLVLSVAPDPPVTNSQTPSVEVMEGLKAAMPVKAFFSLFSARPRKIRYVKLCGTVRQRCCNHTGIHPEGHSWLPAALRVVQHGRHGYGAAAMQDVCVDFPHAVSSFGVLTPSLRRVVLRLCFVCRERLRRLRLWLAHSWRQSSYKWK